MKKILGLVLVLILATGGTRAEETLTLGTLNFMGVNPVLARWTAFTEYLSEHSGQKIKLVPIHIAAMLHRAGQLDVILTQPVLAVTILHQGKHERIATLNHAKQGAQFAGVIIVPVDSDITDLTGLAHKRVAVVDKQYAAGGYLFQAYELVKAGLVPDKDFDQFVIVPNQHHIVRWVSTKRVDAGFVRTGMLSDMREQGFDLSRIRILNEHNSLIGYPRSTPVYPHWALLVLKTLPAETKAKMQQAVLNLTPDQAVSVKAKINGFIPPASYEPVKQLMRALKVPPFGPDDASR